MHDHLHDDDKSVDNGARQSADALPLASTLASVTMTHRADYRGYDEVLSVRVARKTTLLLDLLAISTEQQRADVVRDALDRYIAAMPTGVATAGAAP